MPRFADIRQIPRAGYQVNVGWDYLEVTLARWGDNQLYRMEIEPDFQRPHVWTMEQRTRYIEWILMGGESGRDIYWNCPGWMNSFKGPLQLVDGLQRVTAVRMFLRNEVPIFGGNYFNEYTDKVWRPDFIFHVNNLNTRREVLNWYLDMNSGGTVHTQEQLDKVRALLEAETPRINKGRR